MTLPDRRSIVAPSRFAFPPNWSSASACLKCCNPVIPAFAGMTAAFAREHTRSLCYCACTSLPKIRALHFLVIKQRLAATGQDDLAAFHDIGVIGNVERHERILLDEQDRNALPVDCPDGLEHAFDHHGR